MKTFLEGLIAFIYLISITIISAVCGYLMTKIVERATGKLFEKAMDYIESK